MGGKRDAGRRDTVEGVATYTGTYAATAYHGGLFLNDN